jgi:hypothetical protein
MYVFGYKFTHVQQQNRVKGGCFLLGAGCLKMAKRVAFFKSSVVNGTFLEIGAKIT